MKYLAIFRTQIQNRFAYAAEVAAQSLAIVLFVWIFYLLWRATFAASGVASLNGLTLQNTLWYLMLAEVIVLSKPRIARRISEEVKDGTIAYLLNKPMHYLLYQLSIGLGDGITAMLFNLIFGGIITWLLVGPPPSPAGWPLVLIAMLFSWLLDFCFNALIGLAAFIAEEVNAFEWIYQKLLFLLGGLLIPLDFFPVWLQKIALATPFAYTVYGPARLFVEPSLERFLSLVTLQGLWLLVLSGVLLFSFERVVRRLVINGG
jgi:ABC-2 type transport system permease protein